MGSTKIPDKAEKLVKEGKVLKEMNTDKRTYYKVIGETEDHSVIFDKLKNDWSCDCKYGSLQKRECSHIIACKIKSVI